MSDKEPDFPRDIFEACDTIESASKAISAVIQDLMRVGIAPAQCIVLQSTSNRLFAATQKLRRTTHTQVNDMVKAADQATKNMVEAAIAGSALAHDRLMNIAKDRNKDVLCLCQHWYEEHDDAYAGECHAPGCSCKKFTYAPEFNTPEYIAARGGEHEPPCNCAWCCSNAGRPFVPWPCESQRSVRIREVRYRLNQYSSLEHGVVIGTARKEMGRADIYFGKDDRLCDDALEAVEQCLQDLDRGVRD